MEQKFKKDPINLTKETQKQVEVLMKAKGFLTMSEVLRQAVKSEFDRLKEEESDGDVTPELVEELEKLKKEPLIRVKDWKKHLGL